MGGAQSGQKASTREEVATLSLSARLLLAGVFIVAALAKLADRKGSRRALTEFGVPARLASSVGLALPVVELTVAAALLLARSAMWGAIGAAVLLTVFTAAVAVSLARGRRPDCHCFGQVHSSPAGWKTLVRNVALGGAAGLLIVRSEGEHDSSAIAAFKGLSPRMALAVAGIGLLSVVAAWLLRRSRPSTSAAAKPTFKGLSIGTQAPAFQARGLGGEVIGLERLLADERRLMLVFTDPGCGPCTALMPQIGEWQRDPSVDLTVAVVSRGALDDHRARQAEHGLQDPLLQADREMSEAYQVAATPSAVVVRPDGSIGSGLAEGGDQIRALVRSERRRDVAPPLRLPDLDGAPVDLAALRGSRVLVLFWNPGCSFCQAMRDDLRSWEDEPSNGAPELLVVSTGSAEANRAMGLRSTVVLDAEQKVLQRFGARGTPTGVLLDESGAITDIASGASGVRELRMHQGTKAATVGPREVRIGRPSFDQFAALAFSRRHGLIAAIGGFLLATPLSALLRASPAGAQSYCPTFAPELCGIHCCIPGETCCQGPGGGCCDPGERCGPPKPGSNLQTCISECEGPKCGSECCARVERCVNGSCVECELGQHGCASDCCESDEYCDQNQKCVRCGPDQDCGDGCCDLGQRCLDPLRVICGPCEDELCGLACCGPGRFCCGTSRQAGYCCGPEQANKESKELFRRYAKDWEGASADFGIAAGVLTPLATLVPALRGPTLFLAIQNAVARKTKVVASRAADDPPDPRYTVLARARIPRLPTIRRGGGINADAVRALRALLTNQIEGLARIDAFVTSMERAQGAAAAGDRDWATRQTLAGADHAARAAAALRRDKALRARAVRALRASGFRPPSITEGQVKAFQRRVAARGLPGTLTSILRRLGLPRADVAAFRRRILQTPARSAAGRLTVTRLLATPASRLTPRLAADLEAFAKRARAEPLTR